MQIVSKQLYIDNWYIILAAQQLLKNSVNVGRSKHCWISNVKCPQLSKPKATAARNPNSIRWHQVADKWQIGVWMEKKTLGETRLSRGASSPLANSALVRFIFLMSVRIATFKVFIPVQSSWGSYSSHQYGRFVEELCHWLSCRWGLHNGWSSWLNLCWYFRAALWSCQGTGPRSHLDTARIWLTTVNLGINRKTGISVDAILLLM